MGLEHGDDAPIAAAGTRSERRSHLGRQMGVVVDDGDARSGPLALEATGHATEVREPASRCDHVQAELADQRKRTCCVERVVQTRQCQAHRRR